MNEIELSKGEIEQLFCLERHDMTFAGDTLAHHLVNSLIKKGLACRIDGFYAATKSGSEFVDKVRSALIDCSEIRKEAYKPQTIVEQLSKLTCEERVSAFGDIFGVYCRHCGFTDPKCQCWNDE